MANGENRVDDTVLVSRAQADDKSAFEELVRRHSNYVYTNAFFILRNAHEAEDASQEVFVKAYLSIKKFKGLSSFKTWIRKLTVNTCIDKIRVRSKYINKKVSLDKITENYELIFTNPSHNLERKFFNKEAMREVLESIVELDENYRIPLILRDLQDYSYREIARLTGKPIGTVKTNIHRARKIIKEKINHKGT